MVRRLLPHPIATLFPDMPAADFAALVEDIRQNGVKVPILIYRDQILDGRHRYRACRMLDATCPMVEWNGQDPWLEVQARNLMRRHLAKDQIYAIRKLAADRFPELAVNIAAARHDAKLRKAQARGRPLGEKTLTASQDAHRKAAQVIGAQLGVSATTVERVDRLAREAPELVQKVADGEMSVKKALRDVLARKHEAADSDPTEHYSIERIVGRVQRFVTAEWENCPRQCRPKFLYGLQHLLRELIAEQTRDQGPRPVVRSSGLTQSDGRAS